MLSLTFHGYRFGGDREALYVPCARHEEGIALCLEWAHWFVV